MKDLKHDMGRNQGFPLSGRKQMDPMTAKGKKGGKSLADYSDENFSVGNDQNSVDYKNDGSSLNVKQINNSLKNNKNLNSINGHKNSDSNAIIPERRMKYMNGSDNNDTEQDAKKVKKNVQLAPIDHMAHNRNSSVPPLGTD